MNVLHTGIKNKLRIDVRARPVTSYQHWLPLLLTIPICMKFEISIACV